MRGEFFDFLRDPARWVIVVAIAFLVFHALHKIWQWLPRPPSLRQVTSLEYLALIAEFLMIIVFAILLLDSFYHEAVTPDEQMAWYDRWWPLAIAFPSATFLSLFVYFLIRLAVKRKLID